MSNKIGKGVKASLAFFIANVITSGISYITTPIYTRMLTTDEFGAVSLFLTWLNLFGIVAMFSFGNGVFNNGMSDYPEERNEFTFSILILANIITSVFAIIIAIFGHQISVLTKVKYPLLWLMVAIFYLQPAYNFWLVRQRYEYKYKWATIVSVSMAFLSPIVAIISINLFPNIKLYARLFGAETVMMCYYVFFYIYHGRRVKWRVDKKFWKPCILFNLPLIPHYLSMYLLNSCDRIMISKMVSDSATAYYSVAYSVAALATIMWSAVNSSLVPFTYEQCKTKNYKRISDITSPLIGLFGVGCCMVILIAPEVLSLMATSAYTEAKYAIPPIIGGVFFQVQYYLYANIIYYNKQTKYVMYSSFASAILNIGLNYAGIKIFGYIAAGYTTLICYMLQAIMDFFFMRKISGENVYNMKLIVTLSIGVIGVACCGGFLYQNTIVRYSIVAVVLMALLVNYKKIIRIVKAIRG